MTVINGLPAHVLFVHVLVVLAPLTALLEIACAFDGRALREFVPLFEERGAPQSTTRR